MRARRPAAAVLAAAAVLGACGEDEGPVPNARAERGRELIEQHGCGTCHVIGGVDGANGRVGPPLTNFKDNRLVGGQLQNTPENVVRWILEPRRFDPQTAMPDVGLTREQAMAVAEYLYTQ
ncbi:MAG TPA: c-type cytochrome [Thermoleophilaceae bacterium]|nr:c-type cytochrome [Thermoleophilaceae bacterium]